MAKQQKLETLLCLLLATHQSLMSTKPGYVPMAYLGVSRVEMVCVGELMDEFEAICPTLHPHPPPPKPYPPTPDHHPASFWLLRTTGDPRKPFGDLKQTTEYAAYYVDVLETQGTGASQCRRRRLNNAGEFSFLVSSLFTPVLSLSLSLPFLFPSLPWCRRRRPMDAGAGANNAYQGQSFKASRSCCFVSF